MNALLQKHAAASKLAIFSFSDSRLPWRRLAMALALSLNLAACGGGGGGGDARNVSGGDPVAENPRGNEPVNPTNPSDPSGPGDPADPWASREVVVVGYEATSGDAASAVGKVWTNGVAKSLPVGANSKSSVAEGVTWGPNGAIVSGYYPRNHGNFSLFDEAKLWHIGGDITQSLEGVDSGTYTAQSVFATSTDVYVAGSRQVGQLSKALYWKNGSAVALSDVEDSGVYEVAVDIAANSTDVYVAGYDYYIIFNPIYWKNGVKTKLSTRVGYAYSIALDGTDVYVAGTIREPGSVGNTAVVWKNGVAQNLTDPAVDNAVATAVAVSATEDIYVVGTIDTASSAKRAQLWKNGEVQVLEGAVAGSMANGVYVLGSDVFVAGHIDAGNSNTKAAVWVNGKLQTLTAKDGLVASARRVIAR